MSVAPWNKPARRPARRRKPLSLLPDLLEPRRLFVGYVPLAPTPNPVWTTGYFTQAATLDLQAGASAAPDVSAGEASSLPRDLRITATGLPLLQSRAAGAGLELFIDFARNAGGRGTFSLDADRDNFNFAEQLAIYNCWRDVAGFFSAFNVNVTTVLPPTGGADPNFAWLQVTNDFQGGAAYVNSLTKSGPTGTNNSGDAVGRVSGIVHEFGHILGLAHTANYDKYGTVTQEYSNGDGYRNVPTMGIDYNGQPNSRWTLGRGQWGTAGVDIQDDVQVIASKIASVVGGDGFRPDDFGNSIATAFTLSPGAQQIDGYTERYSDADIFQITATAPGPWNFTATPLYNSNAIPKLELLDSLGNVIASRDDAVLRNGPTNEQFVNLSLDPGTYYVRVAGGDYGELGYYKLSATQLPTHFTSNDVGVPSNSGSVTYDATTGVFTQSGGGTDIWTNNDQFRFTYATLTGNGTITARVDSLDNLGTWTKSGVMIRQSLAANSQHAYIGIRPDGQLDTIRRNTSGASASQHNNSGAGPWVRLTRSGNTITYFSSSDGTNWTNLGSTNISMTGPVLIGLATCAWSDRFEAFATFSNVTLDGNITPAAPTYNALPAPASLTAVPAAGANTSLDLAWSPVEGATGYLLERSIDGITFTTLTNLGAAATTHTDINPYGSMRWFYRVSAQDGTALLSAPSAIASAVNKPAAPGTPNFTASVIGRGSTEIDLTWLDTQGETGYRIDRSTDGVNFTFVTSRAANQTAYNVTGLSAGTAYTFRITPLTLVGDDVAPPLLISTQTRMAAVSNLRFTAKSPTSMTIAWNDAPLETGTRVERSTDGATWTFLGDAPQNVTTWTDNGLTPGTEYYYRVMPFNPTFDGIMSGAIFAAAPAATVPAGWSSADIGSVAGSGTALSSTGTTWTLVSGGHDVFNNADAFHFAYKPVAGVDATIVARIDSLEVTDNAAKAGLVIRQDLTPGSKSLAIMMNAGGGYGIDLRTRTAANAGTSYQQLLSNVAAPYWLKLTRAGNTVITYYSADGVSWTTAATTNLSFTGTFYVGLGVNSFSNSQLNTTTFSSVAVAVGNGVGSPTITTPAAASPSTVTGTTTNLSVAANDDGGEAALTYQWTLTAKPAGAPDPLFSSNNSNADKNTTATFLAAGSYTFRVAATDASGLFAASTVTVTVEQILTSVTVTPSSSTIGAGSTKSLTATALDQFNNALSPQPAFTWSVTAGAGSVSASGLYTAPPSATTATIRATTAALSNTAQITVIPVTEEIAWYKFDQPSGTTALDSSGHNRDASLSGSYSLGATGPRDTALTLTPGGTANLPAGIVSTLNDFTIATWVRLASLDTWSRIFDFGTGTGSYMFLTPRAGGTNLPRFGITTTGGGAGEQLVNSNASISLNTWTHLAVRLTGNTATLFINGTAVGTNSNVTLRPSSLGNTTANYLGDSQYSADPSLNGSLDDFRIYSRGLSTNEIRALAGGTVKGKAFHDTNADNTPAPAEPSLPGVTVYLDANNNAQFDPTELSTTTSPDGSFSFTNVPTGTYTVRPTSTPTGFFTASTPAATVTTGGTTTANLPHVRISYTGTENADSYLLRKTPTGQYEILIASILTYTLPANIPSLTFTLAGAADTLTLDPTSGLPLPPSGLSTDADSILIPYIGPTPVASIRQALFNNQLTTPNTDPLRTLGYYDNGATIQLKLTYKGDANLDGILSADDQSLLDLGRLTSRTTWTYGDFNHDGQVNSTDSTLLLTTLSALSTPAPAQPTPTLLSAPIAPPITPEKTETPVPPTTGPTKPAPTKPKKKTPKRTAHRKPALPPKKPSKPHTTAARPIFSATPIRLNSPNLFAVSMLYPVV